MYEKKDRKAYISDCMNKLRYLLLLWRCIKKRDKKGEVRENGNIGI